MHRNKGASRYAYRNRYKYFIKGNLFLDFKSCYKLRKKDKKVIIRAFTEMQ